eukprot:scaffold531362_cov17-Prasinocladus_malaysianus.AAC.1
MYGSFAHFSCCQQTMIDTEKPEIETASPRVRTGLYIYWTSRRPPSTADRGFRLRFAPLQVARPARAPSIRVPLLRYSGVVKAMKYGFVPAKYNTAHRRV